MPQQRISNLISYEEFGRLRFRPFCSGDESYREEIFETYPEEDPEKRSRFILEKIYRDIRFFRWSERPNELAAIHIGTADSLWPQEIAAPILSALGLGLNGGLTYEEVAARFNSPPHWRSQDGKIAFFHTNGDAAYEIRCRFLDGGKLDAIMVLRLDLKIERLL